jgi:hypothetical protein
MNRETLDYISKRTHNEQYSGENNPTMEHSLHEDGVSETEHARFRDNSISARYVNSTNTYRAEGFIEGRVDRYAPVREEGVHTAGRSLEPQSHTKQRKQDLLYELEESFEREVSGAMYYAELAMAAETKGRSEFAEAFYELTKGKLTCAELIRHKLIKHGSYNPDTQTDLEDMYDRAKHMFRRL